MWPKPPPKLIQGETAVVGNRFNRAAGVTKNSLICVGTTAFRYAPPFTSSSWFYITTHFPGDRIDRGSRRIGDAYSPSKLRPFPKAMMGSGKFAFLIP